MAKPKKLDFASVDPNGARAYKCSDKKPTLFVALPRALWRSAGTCACPHCKGAEGFWDTLAVSPDADHTWTVHAPELHSGPLDNFVRCGREGK